MEAIKEAVQAAENYLWGNDEASKAASGEEPVAGVRGKGTPTDPYDAGNAPKDVALEHAEEYAAQMKKEKEAEEAAQEPENKGTISRPLVPASGSSTTPAGGQVRTTESDVPVKQPPAEASVLSTSTHSETTSMPTPSPSPFVGSTTSVKPPTAEIPSQGIPPSPLQASTVTAGDSGASSNYVPSPRSTGAVNVHAQPQAQTTLHEEHYIRSSGYVAEGGDFDAAEPGAGREADRLLAEHHQEVTHGKKQVDKEGSMTPPQQLKPSSGPQHEKNAGTSDSSNKNKTSSHHHPLSHLKEKLHIGKHHP
ncbi:hypothetical protein GX50_02223 [[Emmonsia] crescens]|uniref:Uncharacterized protein n=1 Tax=[Emmonsia] crescens TaxID=73230 RepID=A0A2B7ZP72_9EURO|nr:hypothetical protein GX50_02223 [Emmonsia crescens]